MKADIVCVMHCGDWASLLVFGRGITAQKKTGICQSFFLENTLCPIILRFPAQDIAAA